MNCYQKTFNQNPVIVCCIFVLQVSIIFPKEVEELAKQLGFCKTDSQDKTSPIFG